MTRIWRILADFIFVLDPRKSARSASSAFYLCCPFEHSLGCTLNLNLVCWRWTQPDQKLYVAGGTAQGRDGQPSDHLPGAVGQFHDLPQHSAMHLRIAHDTALAHVVDARLELRLDQRHDFTAGTQQAQRGRQHQA